MLVRVLPEQVSESWDKIRPMIVSTLPPTLRINTDAMSNILAALLKEEAQLWVGYREEGDGTPIYILMTSALTDHVAGARYLLIYSLYALANLTKEDYILGLDTLKTFAQSIHCKELLAYVEDDSFVRRLQAIGGVKVTNLMRL